MVAGGLPTKLSSEKKIDWPLFPGYLFIRTDPDETLPVRMCTGVVSIVSFEGRPTPIPDFEIDAVRRLIEKASRNRLPVLLLPGDIFARRNVAPVLQQIESTGTQGDRVEVVHGPLKGVFGRLVRKGPHARLVLSVDLIAQAVSVTVDAADVRAA